MSKTLGDLWAEYEYGGKPCGPNTHEGRVFQAVALAVAVLAGFAGYLGWVPSAEAGVAIITSAGVAWLAERWL